MKLLRYVFAGFVAALAVAALLVVVASAALRPFSARANAQNRRSEPFDHAQGRPFGNAQGGGRALTVLPGRGAEIGVRIADRSEGGVVVEDVQADSPAEKAGLNGRTSSPNSTARRRSARQFARLVHETPAGRTVRRPRAGGGTRSHARERRGAVLVCVFWAIMRDLRDLAR